MKLKLFKLLQDIGWVFDDYEDFNYWLVKSEEILGKNWESLQLDIDLGKNNFKSQEQFVEHLGFVVDLLRVLIKEEAIA